MVSVAAFTGDAAAASARFRVRQYIPKLATMGVAVHDYAAALGAYPPRPTWLRPAWTLAAVASRLPSVAQSYRYDVTLLQREMISTLYTVERFTKKPRVLDIDDAIWLHRRGHNHAALTRATSAVIAGNDFIAEWARTHNPRVYRLPTAVDTDRFSPATGGSSNHEQTVIGWMGLSSGYTFLASVAGALHYVLDKYPDVMVRMVSDIPPPQPELRRDRMVFTPWSEDGEVDLVRSLDIGLMPLEDSLWCRGKCSYKMLLYMSCGIPVVVSDLGMNSEVLRHGRVGFGPRSDDEWIAALECLVEHPSMRKELGGTGRNVVEEHYSVNTLAPRLAAILEECSSC